MRERTLPMWPPATRACAFDASGKYASPAGGTYGAGSEEDTIRLSVWRHPDVAEPDMPGGSTATVLFAHTSRALDLCPVPIGESTQEALRRSVDLARHVEQWGFRRYWVAEHHNMPGIASSGPCLGWTTLCSQLERSVRAEGG
jgi:hypothetical protein